MPLGIFGLSLDSGIKVLRYVGFLNGQHVAKEHESLNDVKWEATDVRSIQ